MSSFRVILDACVLIPAPLRDTLLRAADAGLYRMYWSDDILEEVRRNLVSVLGKSEDQAQGLVDTMREYFPEATITAYQSLIGAMTNHPKDRHVLAAAVISGVQVIVTSNLRDFPSATRTSFNIDAQSPDEFLVHLFHLNSERMVQIVVEQAQDLQNPPKTVHEVLDMLAQQAPKFAALMRAALDERSG